MAQPITYQFEDEAAPVTGGVTYQFEDTPAVPPVAASPSFMGGVGDALSKRVANIGDVWAKPTNDPRQEPSVMSAFTRSPNVALQTMGQVAGGVNDVIGEGLKAGYRNLVPEGAQQAISGFGSDLIKSGPGQSAVSLMQAIQEKYGQAKQVFPEGFRNIEAVANIAGAVPMGWAGKEGAGILKGAVTPVINASNVEKAIDKAISYGYNKGIQPKFAGNSDAFLKQKHAANFNTAVRDIVDQAPTPLSKSDDVLTAFSTANRDTKINLWNESHAISKEAGELGAQMDYQPILNKINSMSVDAVALAGNPGLANALKPYKEAWENLIKQNGRFGSPVEGEKILTDLNNATRAFYRDPNMSTSAAKIAELAAEVKSQLQLSLGDLKGTAYDGVRRRLGAQLDIEKAVADRATQYNRKGVSGFFDLGNLSVARDVARGLSGDPVALAQAASTLAIKKLMKAENDTANIIRKMFKDVEALNAIKAKYAPPDMSSFARRSPVTIDAYQEALDIPRRDATLALPPGGQVVPYQPRLLEAPRRDATLELPPGQTFEIPRPSVPALQNTVGEGFSTRPSGINEGLSNGTISRDMLREMIRKSKDKKTRYIQPGY